MLFADKRALETNLQVSLLKIREKELRMPPRCAILAPEKLLTAPRAPRRRRVLHAELHRDRHAGGAALGLRVQRHHPGRHTRGVERCPQGALPVRDDCGDGLRADRGAQQHAVLDARPRPRAPRPRRLDAPRRRRADARVPADLRLLLDGARRLPPVGAHLRVARVLDAGGARDDDGAPDVRLRHVQVRAAAAAKPSQAKQRSQAAATAATAKQPSRTSTSHAKPSLNPWHEPRLTLPPHPPLPHRYFRRIYQRFALESDRYITGKFEFGDQPQGPAVPEPEGGGSFGEVRGSHSHSQAKQPL